MDMARRGRPRNEQSTTDILVATLELVSEVGLSALTMDAVASRAGVSKATIYRRWSSKEQLLLDAWMSAVRRPDEPDTGSLRDDLRAMFTGLGLDPLPGVDIQRVFPQMIAAAKVNDDVAAAYRAFITERRRPMQAVLRRAVARGELAADVDLDLVHDLLVAPVVYRWLVSDGPVDESVTTRLIEIVLTGVDALPRLEV
ncbi:MAG: TetR/AcrR family transcriptional regulator [Acidimicrobiales bacterium]|nr:TetR/AcrR family transcriptional regulator [Acidimicrobiales bacterium]MCB9393228.1 TetR/AcrR family transcriptional regulator [Acidimicrobiaceae bacterium]